jgi:MFS family permease
MFFFILLKKETGSPGSREPFWKNIGKVDGQLRLYLLVVFLFTLGNSSNAFIILKANIVGFNAVSVILLYFIYNVTASVLSMPFGKMSDRIGRKKLLVPGYLAFSLCYLGFAFASSRWMMVLAFVVYGAYTAMIAGVERAFAAEISPPELNGTMLGLQSTVAGIALLPASMIAGVLWNAYGAAVPFVFGAGLSLTAAIILIVFMKNTPTIIKGERTDASP